MLDSTEIANFDFGQIIDRLQKKGASCSRIPESDIVEIKYEGNTILMVDHVLPYIPLTYEAIIEHKFSFKRLLQENDIPCFKGNLFHTSQQAAALDYCTTHLQWPVTIKAADLACGDLVFCAVRTETVFNTIWSTYIAQQNTTQWFVVEECWPFTPDYRLVKFTDEPLRAAKRTVPTAVGNGTHTIRELVAQENKKRTTGERNCLCDIFLADEDGVRCLEDQNLSLDSVLAKGQEVNLRYTTNLSYGGMAETIPENEIHSDYEALIHYVWSLFPDLPFMSLDIFAQDLSKPITPSTIKVNESHITPGLGMFLSPAKGDSIDYYTKLADIILHNISSSYAV